MPTKQDFVKNIKNKYDKNLADFVPKTRAPYLLHEEIKEEKANNISSKEEELEIYRDEKTDQNDLKIKLLTLKGKQKELLIYLINLCLKNNSLSSGPVLIDDLVIHFKTSKNAVYSIIQKTLNKGIFTKRGKQGKCGFTEYFFKKEIYDMCLSIIQNKRNEAVNIFNKKNENEINYINNQHITNNEGENSWDSINISPIEEYGFRHSHVKQLQKLNCTTPEILQESIYHLAFGLKNVKDTQKYENPINIFMGVLKKGDNWHEEKYIDPKDAALKKIIEQRKKRLEDRLKRINELKELEFNAWFEELTEKEILKTLEEIEGGQGGILYDSYKKGKKITAMTKAQLKNYFEESIWPSIKEKLNI
jgi:hypothetical protein